jgi:hypothetical protein
MNKALEHAIDKVLRLPEAQQEVAAEMLEQIALGTAAPHTLSDEERARVDEAFARARRGEFASDTDVDSIIRRPWRGD